MMHRRLLFLILIFSISSSAGAQRLHVPQRDTMGFSKSLTVLPDRYYTQHLGFFCRKELQLQKVLALPLYFRLGSKAHVDYLEQKPNAQRWLTR
jgi:hypothetical protein